MSTITALTNAFRKAKRSLTCTAVIATVAICGSALTSEIEGQSKAPASGTTLPPNADPQKAAQYLWDTILTKCGDSWIYDGSKLKLSGDYVEQLTEEAIQYLRQTGKVRDPSDLVDHERWEYRGVTFRLVEIPVSTADRLNGIDLRATATLASVAWRKAGEEWRETPRDQAYLHEGYLLVSLKKIKGTWSFENISANELSSFKKPSCNALQPR